MSGEPEAPRPRRPGADEIEAHFNDQAGTVPVARDFDSPPGALCGNGMRFYAVTRPAKDLPPGWSVPPEPGSDPTYEGPSPTAPFKESPYTMPTPQVVLARPPVVDQGEPEFVRLLEVALSKEQGSVAWIGGRDPSSLSPALAGRLQRHECDALDEWDDERAAQALTGLGVAFVLVDRAWPVPAPWVEDRMGTVRLRLRDGGDLSWFHPRILGSGWVLYAIAPPLILADADKRRLTALVQDVLAGRPLVSLSLPAPLDAVGMASHHVVVSLRMRSDPRAKGRKVAKRMARLGDIAHATVRAAVKLVSQWHSIREAVQRDFSIPLPERPDPRLFEIEIDVVYDACVLTDRAPASFAWTIQAGLHGLYLREADGTGRYLEPGAALQNAASGPVVFFETLLKKSGLSEYLRPARTAAIRASRGKVLHEAKWRHDTRFTLLRFRTVNWISDPETGGVIDLYRGVPLKRVDEVTRDALLRSLTLGAEWLIRNQSADGQFGYRYVPTNREGRRWMAGGNIVRHALNPYTLLLVNALAPDARLEESARRGIDFTLKFLRREGDRCVICHRDPPAPYYNAKLGTNAVTILSILKLAEVGDIGGYEDALIGLGEELLYMQDPNGHFRQYDVPPGHPYHGAENAIAPGEFILALARLSRYRHDERYLDAVERALAFYLASWRAMRERTVVFDGGAIYDEEHRVNLVGIVPWLVQAMKEMLDITGEHRYAEIGFEMQDWLDETFFYHPGRARWPDWVGGAFKAHLEQPAVNSCQYIEGAAAAFAMAKSLGRDVERRRDVVLLGARFCLQLQYDGFGSTYFLPSPDEAMGGFRYSLSHLHLRNDFNYHAMAALAFSAAHLDEADYKSVRNMDKRGAFLA